MAELKQTTPDRVQPLAVKRRPAQRSRETRSAELQRRLGNQGATALISAVRDKLLDGNRKSALEPLIGRSVQDGGGYTFVLEATLSFLVTSTPPGKETSLGKRLTPEHSSAKVVEAWQTLASKLESEQSARGVAETTKKEVPPASLVSEASKQAPAPVADSGSAAIESKRDNLVVARKLAAEFNHPHSYDREKFAAKTADDPVNGPRLKLLAAGETSKLKTIVCSEFTILTLAQAGWDLNTEYKDLTTGLSVAFRDPARKSTKKRPIPPPSFVTYVAVTQNLELHTAAILAAQAKTVERITAGSDRAKEVGADDRTEDFLYTTPNTLTAGIEISEANQFGAGAAAASLGGKSITPEDRKPGDLQQSLRTNDGKTKGEGHSSQVWSVHGSGIAKLGVAGCPTLRGTPSTPIGELAPGWYQVSGGGLLWEVGPDTDPSTVARLTVRKVQTIDANTGRGEDATGLSKYEAQQPFSAVGRSTAYSIGRLPTSKWFHWTPQLDVVATQLSAAVEKSPPMKAKKPKS